MMSHKPNLTQMSLSQLRSYVLANRNDNEAWQEFASRSRPNSIHFDADLPLTEEKKKLKQLIENLDKAN
jgi:hypothetical protein